MNLAQYKRPEPKMGIYTIPREDISPPCYSYVCFLFFLDRGSRSSFDKQGAGIASLFSDSRNGRTTTQLDNGPDDGLDKLASNDR